MEQTKKSRATPVFWVLLMVFAILNTLDSAPMWERLISAGGWLNTLPHALLTLGAGPSTRSLHWSSIPQNIGSAFPGVFFAVFPVLLLILSKRGKKKTALVFSIINLLGAMLFALCAFSIGGVYGVCWLMYVLAGVLLLLDMLGVMKNKRVLAVLFFVMGIISVGAFFWLSCYRISFMGESTFVGLSGIQRFFTSNTWRLYRNNVRWIGGMFYPLSRAILFFVLSAGVLCPFEPTIRNYFEAKRREKAKRYEYLYTYKSRIREEKGMFANAGGKIKAVAQVLTWIGIIGSVIGGISLISTSFIAGLLTAGIGSLLSWVSALALYGFGELVENSDIRTNLAVKADRQKNA